MLWTRTAAHFPVTRNPCPRTLLSRVALHGGLETDGGRGKAGGRYGAAGEVVQALGAIRQSSGRRVQSSKPIVVRVEGESGPIHRDDNLVAGRSRTLQIGVGNNSGRTPLRHGGISWDGTGRGLRSRRVPVARPTHSARRYRLRLAAVRQEPTSRADCSRVGRES